jgi:hypothetical protein
MYSPSSGKVWRIAVPPREPNGRASSIRSSCHNIGDTGYVSTTGRIDALPTARRLILRALDT